MAEVVAEGAELLSEEAPALVDEAEVGFESFSGKPHLPEGGAGKAHSHRAFNPMDSMQHRSQEQFAEHLATGWNYSSFHTATLVFCAITVIVLVGLISAGVLKAPSTALVGLGVAFAVLAFVTIGLEVYTSTLMPNIGDMLHSKKLSHFFNQLDVPMV
jgi:hypothetical protein